MHPWMADVSLLSAPWLALAFFAGCAQAQPARAALLGLACTLSALAGYGFMTLSPIENAHLTLASATAFVRSEREVFAGALLSGPLFGWLGQQWRSHRAWWAGLVTAAAICLEPTLRLFAGTPIRSSSVFLAEIGAGVALAVFLCTTLSYNCQRADT